MAVDFGYIGPTCQKIEDMIAFARPIIGRWPPFYRYTLGEDVYRQMIQLLPSSYNQTRNVMINYEVLANIYKSRKDHKLDEWRNFCEWIEELPYSELITGGAE